MNHAYRALELHNIRRYIEKSLRNCPVDKDMLANLVAKLLNETNIKSEVRIDIDDPETLAFKEEMNIRNDPNIHVTLSIPQPPLQIIKFDFTLIL
jgi:hypothetical protein